MTLSPDEFIRRFLLHVLPKGFHRIRHYGLLAGSTRKAHLERARQLLGVAPLADNDMAGKRSMPPHHAHVAAGAWSSSRRSNDGANHAHPLDAPPHPWPSRHDPAWLDPAPPRETPALPATMPLASATPPTALTLISRPDPGRNRRRISAPVAVYQAAEVLPGRRSARRTNTRKSKTP